MITTYLLVALISTKISHPNLEEAKKLFVLNAEDIQKWVSAYEKAGSFGSELELTFQGEQLDRLSKAEMNSGLKIDSTQTEKFRKAFRNWHHSRSQASQFEKSLDARGVSYITQDNEDSIYRKMKRFPFSEPALCPSRQYESLKALVGLDELVNRGPLVMRLVAQYEGQHRLDYLERLIRLLSYRVSDSQKRLALETYYRSAKAGTAKNLDPQSIEQLEEAVEKTGLPRAEVKNYSNALAASAPDCLRELNPQFISYLEHDLAHAEPVKVRN